MAVQPSTSSSELERPLAGLAVSVDSGGCEAWVRLAGELDLAGRATVEEALRLAESNAPTLLVLDLTRLELIDSTGLRVLLAAQRRASEQGRRVVLLQGGAAVRRALEITGLHAVFEIPHDGVPFPEAPAA